MNALAYFAIFGAGVATLASPCVLPLVPAWIIVVTDAAHGRSIISSALTFTAGFTTVFVALGGLASWLGAIFGARLNGFSRFGGGLLLILGVLLLGAASGKVTRRWQALARVPKTTARMRPFALGATFAAAWSPCVGPLLGAALLTAAQADPVHGMALLAVYSLGLATPFLVLCLLGASTAGAVPQVRTFALRVGPRLQVFTALLMIILGGWLVLGNPLGSIITHF